MVCSRVRRLALVASTQLALTLGVGCADDPLTKVLPQIEVDPPMLDFGEGCVDADNPLTITIRNRGTGVLELSSVEIDPATGSQFSVKDPPRNVGALASRELTVIFVPLRAHEQYAATLVLRSNDPVRPELRVPLAGVGGVREIEVFPLDVDFGTVDEHSSPRRQIEVRNVGCDPLIVSAVTWTSTSVDMKLAPGTFTSGTIASKTSTIVELVYSPTDLGADSGKLTIATNDEDEPTVEVTARGRANLAPRAIAWICDKSVATAVGCDGEEKLREVTAGFRKLLGLDGRESYDPEGGAITQFTWRFVEPSDTPRPPIFHSTDDLTLRHRATGDVTVDKVGHYTIQLVAKDDRGLESSALAESIVSISPRELEALLRWDVGTDVDLHFVEPGGQIGDYGSGGVHTSTGSDCSTFNRAPNWSDLASERDDPSLDKDDVTGRGPEVVSLDGPQDGGTYGVFAHYCDSRMTRTPVNVTVEIYVKGVLVQTIPEIGGYPLLPGELWGAADVTWRAGTPPRADITAHASIGPTQAPNLCLH